jgi:hypothetical protein
MRIDAVLHVLLLATTSSLLLLLLVVEPVRGLLLLTRIGGTSKNRSSNMGLGMVMETSEGVNGDHHVIDGIADDGDDSSPSSFRLGYITDVEGNLDYFLRFVEGSKVLDLLEGNDDCSSSFSSTSLKLSLRDHCYFVYGGDAVDKGPGDIRLVRALVDLKRRHPNRVYLLVGNRDLNKLRFTAELSDADMARPIRDIPPPHWDPSAPTLQEFLERMLIKEKEDKNVSIKDLNTRVNRLHYLLKHTLGCPETFTFRRKELSLLWGLPKSEISDEQVVDSFLHEAAHQEGSLRQYFEVADVAVCIGNTLFCHGAVDQATMKFVPSVKTKFENPQSKPPPAEEIDNVQEWVNALNDYLRHGLADFYKRPHWNEERTTRGGEALMALQNRPAMWGRSIISNCYGDGGCITTEKAIRIRNEPQQKDMERTNPLAFEKVCSDPMDQSVADWLLKDGIQRVVVGHKPTGDCPAVLSALYTGVEIVSADTSFSDTSAGDNRGKALALVEIVGSSTTNNQLELSGVLRDGSRYSTAFARLHPEGVDSTTGDPYLGKVLREEGWWIKAITVDDRYHLTRGHGRNVEYDSVRQECLAKESILDR